MAVITRNYAHKLESLLQLFPIVVILGPRQSGKTTLARQIRPGWQYLDLENPDDNERINRDPTFFFKQFEEHIILDEAQANASLFKVLRGVVDANRSKMGRFILTGSASPELYRQTSETLAGRVAILELSPLKTNEYAGTPLSSFYKIFESPLNKNYLSFDKPLSQEMLYHLWIHGSYPEPALRESPMYSQLWYENYKRTYVERDIGHLFPRLNRMAFQRFLSTLGNLSGTIINRSDLARSLEIDEKTVREYLQIISGTFFWRSLPSFEKNVTKSITKMPKGYVRDTGILHFLMKVQSYEDLYRDPRMGNSFECFVIEELLKGLAASPVTNVEPYYYRTRNGAEIDLILDGPFGTLPIEIKFGSKVDKKQLLSLNTFIQEHQLPFGLLINQSDHIEWINEHVLQVPFNYI